VHPVLLYVWEEGGGRPFSQGGGGGEGGGLQEDIKRKEEASGSGSACCCRPRCASRRCHSACYPATAATRCLRLPPHTGKGTAACLRLLHWLYLRRRAFLPYLKTHKFLYAAISRGAARHAALNACAPHRTTLICCVFAPVCVATSPATHARQHCATPCAFRAYFLALRFHLTYRAAAHAYNGRQRMRGNSLRGGIPRIFASYRLRRSRGMPAGCAAPPRITPAHRMRCRATAARMNIRVAAQRAATTAARKDVVRVTVPAATVLLPDINHLLARYLRGCYRLPTATT